MNFERLRNIAVDIINQIYEEECEGMPVRITKINSKYRVSTPHGIHAKGTTKAKAQAQARLLRAVEHGWKPTGKRRK